MVKSSARPAIRLRGVRHNNLKNFDLDLPLHRLIVVTGLSGSGKSSLAFDTLFAEGQRRYIETFSPYARQFFDRMDKPRVDSIEGIPPAIAIEQRNAVRTTRSTVGTMTEICEYMKNLWPQIARLHCRQCGQPVTRESPQRVWEAARGQAANDVLITFDLPLTEKLSLADSLALIAKQGYQRLLVGETVRRLDELVSEPRSSGSRLASLTVVQDRLKPADNHRARFVEACEQAYHFGKGKLALRGIPPAGPPGPPRRFSNRLHCARCDIEYRPPSPALFSFNHPAGACATCRGFGRIISIDYSLAIPDRSKTLAQGVVKPWLTGLGADCQADLMRMCRHFEIPTDVPFEKLPRKWQDFVIEGEPGYGTDEEHEWPRAWYGVKGYFRWLESKAYKMHVRVLLSRYRAYTPCPDCAGQRLRPEALLYRVSLPTPGDPPRPVGDSSSPEGPPLPSELTLPDFYRLPIRDALRFAKALAAKQQRKRNDPLTLVLGEVLARLKYLEQVGLGYLTLDRPTRSLSGGETERVNLTTCLGTRLVNTLFVLDEPSVGLHPRDTERLVKILEALRDTGNTVVVVEHEPSVMRAADEIVDLGPGHGATGGELVFQGTYPEILQCEPSLTGQYLAGRRKLEIPSRRPVNLDSAPGPARGRRPRDRFEIDLRLNDALVPFRTKAADNAPPILRLSNVSRHNLCEVSVAVPLRRLVCVTGVSGSGKTTLVREVLLPLLASRLDAALPDRKASDRLSAGAENGSGEEEDSPDSGDGGEARLEGWESLKRVALVDQAILAKTPRSNPAVYVGAFDPIREVFARTEEAKQRGLGASAFSFNSRHGQCEKCRGAGFEKIEMQFLSDVFIRCPDCDGRRYRPHILEIRVRSPRAPAEGWSIADLLEATADEAISFLSGLPSSPQTREALQSLRLLDEVGLGYLKLGQPLNTLSGGESQRLKLVRELAEHASTEPTLFLFDEPTTGLHFDDVRILLKLFQRLVNAGHSVLVIEHHLDVIKTADWVIDLGPGAGDEGGKVVAVGTPEAIAGCAESHTGRALKPVLDDESAPPPCPALRPRRARKPVAA